MTDPRDPLLAALMRATRPGITDEELEAEERRQNGGWHSPEARAAMESAFSRTDVALNDDNALRAIALGQS